MKTQIVCCSILSPSGSWQWLLGKRGHLSPYPQVRKWSNNKVSWFYIGYLADTDSGHLVLALGWDSALDLECWTMLILWVCWSFTRQQTITSNWCGSSTGSCLASSCAGLAIMLTKMPYSTFAVVRAGGELAYTVQDWSLRHLQGFRNHTISDYYLPLFSLFIHPFPLLCSWLFFCTTLWICQHSGTTRSTIHVPAGLPNTYFRLFRPINLDHCFRLWVWGQIQVLRSMNRDYESRCFLLLVCLVDR